MFIRFIDLVYKSCLVVINLSEAYLSWLILSAHKPKFCYFLVTGPKKYDVRLRLPEDEAGDALCVKHLTDAVCSLTEIPADAQKLIYKGKLPH